MMLIKAHKTYAYYSLKDNNIPPPPTPTNEKEVKIRVKKLLYRYYSPTMHERKE